VIEPLVDARSGMSRRVGDRRPSVRAPRRVLGLLWLALPLLGVGLALADGTALPRSGAQLYRAACAACHGDDGRGQPRAVVGFDTELPDFTDCSFATREADSDWFAVVHEGGPARGFARMMPAFGGALSKAQIARALAHVRTFCRQRRSWPRGELNLPRPLVTSKAFPEDEAVLSSGVVLRGEHAVVNDLVFETRLGARGQLEVVLPIAFREQADGDGWAGGLGDIVVGGKWALLHSLR